MKANEALKMTLNAASDELFDNACKWAYDNIERVAKSGERTLCIRSEYLGDMGKAVYPLLDELRADGYKVTVKRGSFGEFDHAYINW